MDWKAATQAGCSLLKIVTLTRQQIRQPLKSLPNTSSPPSDFEDKLDNSFVSNVFCSCVSSKSERWIPNASAANHMTLISTILIEPQVPEAKMVINLPNHSTSILMLAK